MLNKREILDYVDENGDTDFFVFAIYLRPELNFSKKHQRFVPLQMVRCLTSFRRTFYLNFIKYGVNGNLLSSKIPYEINSYDPLSVFLSRDEAVEAYEKEMASAQKELSLFKEEYSRRADKVLEDIQNGFFTFLERG